MYKAMKKHISLVGFQGAGKTTYGAQIASMFSIPFYDGDTIVEDFLYKRETSTISIQDAYLKYSEDTFRKIEFDAYQQLVDLPAGIIATGGGCVMNGSTRQLLSRYSRATIHIKKSPLETYTLIKEEMPQYVNTSFNSWFIKRNTLYSIISNNSASSFDEALKIVREYVI